MGRVNAYEQKREQGHPADIPGISARQDRGHQQGAAGEDFRVGFLP